ncbi:unnamed protein product [Cercopithifilaria johnstoni]|uniref:Uncharacterized protein n=1 Tax=Cercopithifilaria johnstoni TaxID=2874296 RepID=A0A8J2Q9B0_9BILA|nr:unnamed protein product [Cercopithifilaria johnstoni]
MDSIQACLLLMFGCLLVAEINGTYIENTTPGDTTILTQLVDDIKLYLKKFYELNEHFPEEFVNGKDKIDEIEEDARKIIEAINRVRNTWNDNDYEKNLAIICGMTDEEHNVK